MNKSLENLAQTVVAELYAAKLSVSCAESCTGGMLSELITSVSGASAVFELGITSYSSRIKNSFLGVKDETLSQFGAVSRQTAREMAARVRKLAGSNIGVSVTGVAGPEPCEGKEVGRVYIALADNAAVTAQRLDISGCDRNGVREAACEAVLRLIQNYIKETLQ